MGNEFKIVLFFLLTYGLCLWFLGTADYDYAGKTSIWDNFEELSGYFDAGGWQIAIGIFMGFKAFAVLLVDVPMWNYALLNEGFGLNIKYFVLWPFSATFIFTMAIMMIKIIRGS